MTLLFSRMVTIGLSLTMMPTESDEGREALLLTDLNPISLWKHAEINVAGWSSEEDYKADRLSLAQQTLDYLLQFNRNDHAIVNLGKFPIYSKDGDIDTTENICFVDFDGRGSVNLFTESGKTINLVYGQEWNMMGGGDYIISTGNMLNTQLEERCEAHAVKLQFGGDATAAEDG